MQEEAKSYLQKKALALDLGRGQALEAIQKLLDEEYPQKTRAVSLNDGVLKIVTPSAPLANELRLNQVQLMKDLDQAIGFKYPITRLLIQISGQS